MRIGIDVRPLQGETKHRGIGKTLENLVVALRKVDSNNSYVYYVDGFEKIPPIFEQLNHNEKILFVRSNKLRRAKYIRSVVKSFKPFNPDKRDVDIFYQPDASLGVPTFAPTVVMFYDLIPLVFRDKEKVKAKGSHRKYKSQLANEMYWHKYKKDLKQYTKAIRILSISESSKNDLVMYRKNINKDRVRVLHLGVSSAKKNIDNPVIENLKPYLLYVGGIDYRKNVKGLLEDFFTLKPKFPRLRLVLIGKEFSLKEQLNDLGWDKIIAKNRQWENDIIIPGFVTEEELFTYYKNADVFVFPSIYEGFGLPVLEAMTAGTPVVAYNTSSIPEVTGDAALLVDKNTSLSPYIEKLLINKDLRKNLIKKGFDRVGMFSWEETARVFLMALEEIKDADQ